jgi:hypothetical protein
MTSPLSDGEKAALAEVLNSSIFQKAASLALAEAWKRKRGAETTEQCALAFQYQEGARDIVETLYIFSDVKKDTQILPKRLIHR